MLKEIENYDGQYMYNSIEKDICFINPSFEIPNNNRAEMIRTYLSLGSLISALMDRTFIKEFALKNQMDKFIFKNIENYPKFNISLIQLSLRKGKKIYQYIKDFFENTKTDPIMVCTTATCLQINEVTEIASAVKKIKPCSLRVIGGPHVSIVPFEILNGSEFQVCCIGEGVETITEIALNLALSWGKNTLQKIPGIAYKDKSGKLYLNKRRKYIFTLDDYPYPSKSLNKFIDIDNSRKNSKDIIYILGGFGCPYNCIFCAQKAIHNSVVRERSADNIFAEIYFLYQIGFRRFAIVQETFTNDKKRIKRFCELISRNSVDIEWTIESRINQINYSQLERMKKSGLKLIQLGLESGDQNLLEYIDKKIKIKQAINLIEWLNQLKINTTIYFLVGLPKQDWQSILKTAFFFINHVPYNDATMHAAVSIAIPYPGTKIFQENLVKTIKNPYRKNENMYLQIRNPDVYTNEEGNLRNKSYTYTDSMTAQEILESLIYLADLCFFILHVKFDKSLNSYDKFRFYEYSKKLFYMIERRTIRDLIAQSYRPMNHKNKQIVLSKIEILDKGKEKHLRDVTKKFEKSPKIFIDFLCQISFINGFYTMISFSVMNRIKWMKLCCILWHYNKRSFDKFRFEKDCVKIGEHLNKCLSKINQKYLHRKLVHEENNITHDSFKEIKEYLYKMNIAFHIKGKEGIFTYKEVI